MTRLGFDPCELRHPGRLRTQRGASRLQGWSLILAVGLFATGCDAFTFNPPRPAELAPTATTPRVTAGASGGAASSPSSRPVEIVLTPRIAADVETLTTAARLQAGIDKLRIQVTAPPEGAAATQQADLVRKAAARKPPVILIEAPAEPGPELIQAAGDARKAGIAVVGVGRPLTTADASTSGSAAESGPPMFTVVTEPLKTSAVLIVADAFRSAKNGGLAIDTGAVILVDPTVDSLVQDRADALRKVLESSGVKKIDDLKFERTIKDGQDRLVEYLEAHPETTLVFAVDAGGVAAADDVTGILKEKHRYAIAGYSDNEAARNQVVMGEYAAIGVSSIEKLLRHAINVATGILKGRDVPARVQLEVQVHEANPAAGLPRMRVAPPEKPSMLKQKPSMLKKVESPPDSK